jgi:hypothetical protein
MRVLRTAGCAAAALVLAAALEASPAMADDCGVVVVVQLSTCQSPAAQPSPGRTHHASPTPAPSPAVTLPGAPPVVPVAPAGSLTAVAVPAGSPQTSTRPPVGTVPVEVTTAEAIADTSPSPVPTRTTTPDAIEASPPRATESGPAIAGAWLLVLGGLLVAGSAVPGLKRPWRAFGRT